MARVLLTDFAWPDDTLERDVLAAAGLELVSGPSGPAPEKVIDALAAEHCPDAIMTCWARVSSRAIGASPNLRVVARLGVGLDNIDVAAASAAGVLVTNVPDYCVEEVSDHAVGLLLAWARGLVGLDRSVKAGRWEPATAKLRRVRRLTIGLVGFGRIARRAAHKLSAFGARLVTYHPSATGAPGVEAVWFDELLRVSDAVIIFAPLTEATYHLFTDDRFALMRDGACLINVSRGSLVSNDALLAALETGKLSCACLDVIEGEPSPPPALITRPDVIVTPHVAFSSDASIEELRRRGAEEVVRVLRGEPAHHPCNDYIRGRDR